MAWGRWPADAPLPVTAVDLLKVSRIDMPWPTRPVTISLTPWVPLRMVRLASVRPRAAASTRAGRISMMWLAAMSSWLPSRSEAALALFASAWPSAVDRSAWAAASALTWIAWASASASVVLR